ncbi:GTP-binding protein [Plantactinospora sp. GCM10030261]|uniref:GTP-binding protein n=1 Tax=Plantactinospora sp. GCM10030261 TaxID=3273420 RepID=UPI003612C994
MHIVNLGILAHVDAGKTSLTERLLHAVGVIDEVGSVDRGSTQTDSLALERQRGITIKSAVVSFAVDGVTVNLIDTPGHPDFIAEVERALRVLDGAVLVISAVEGVQAQTRVLMRTLRRLRIPTLIFINKIDRAGARYAEVLRDIAEKLTPDIVAMGSATGAGTRDATVEPYPGTDTGFVARLTELLAEHDDATLAAYLDGGPPPYHRLRSELAAQTARAVAYPVFVGSAITGAGVAPLVAGIRTLLPAAEGDPDGPVSGTVFKIERGPAGEKIAYVRLFAGTIRVRERLPFRGTPGAKVTALAVFERGAAVPRPSAAAGQIAKVWGLGDIRIGDSIGGPGEVPPAGPPRSDPPAADRRPGEPAGNGTPHFSPPTLATVVVPERDVDRLAAHAALSELAEQDPLINLRQDETRQEIVLSLYGEVQKEVIQATLADEYGVRVGFRESTTIYVERLTGTGAAVEFKDGTDNPFLATVGLRLEPAPAGSGVIFRLGVELGSMPYAFFVAVEETVRQTLGQGLRGWEVPDCLVTMTHSGYYPKQSRMHGTFDKSMSSTGWDFRYLTPLVLTTALRRAGTRVHEPVHRFRLELPTESFAAVMPVLVRLGGTVDETELRGSGYLLTGDLPAARVHDLEQRLPALTSGEGTLESTFDHYQPVRGPAPERERWDHNPLNRKEYLLHVLRRV